MTTTDPSTTPTPEAYPLRLGLQAPLEVARWRPLLHWLMAIPHWIPAATRRG